LFNIIASPAYYTIFIIYLNNKFEDVNAIKCNKVASVYVLISKKLIDDLFA